VNARPLLWLALAQLAIGAAGVFARFALSATGPLMVGALRMTIASAAVASIAARRQSYVRHDAPTERRLLLAGGMLAVHFATWFAALQHASIAVATLLVCSTPLFTETWSVLRTRTWRPPAVASMVLAVAGVAIVAGVPNRTETPLGIALALCGAVAMAAYLLLVRASDPRYGTLAVVGRTYPVAAAVLAVGALAVRDPLPPPHASAAWAGILALAFISQLLGHTALNAAVRSLSVTFVAITTLTEPIVAAVAAALIFGERPAPLTGAGAVMILAAIGVAIRAEAGLAKPEAVSEPLT
jgi:drug/metabolite transporter (DMT)-like permease